MKKIFTLLALLVAVVTGAQAQESLLSYTMDNENYAAQTDLEAGNGTIYFGQDKRETSGIAACGYGFKSDGNIGSTKYVKLVPSRAFAAGDMITVKCYCTSNDKGGVYIYDSREGTKLLASYDIPTKSKNLEMTYEYTIQKGDAIIGSEEVYLFRKPDESTFFTEFEVTSGVDPNAPNITAPNVDIMATESGVAATEEIEVTGANLAGSTAIRAYFSPAVDGLSVELASTAIENGSIQTTATISYVATQNVDENTTTLIITDGTTTCEATVTYSAHVTAYQQQAISSATTWDFADVTGTVQYGKEGQDPQEERLYANIPELGFKSTFNAKALTFEGEYAGRGGYAQNGTLRFKTLVPGTVEVTFSNTGGSNNNRYLQVNGTTGTVEAVGTAKNTEEFEVAKGTVEITGVPGEGGTNGALRYYKVVFTPSEFVPVAADVTMSFPEASYTTAMGEEFIEPELTVTLADGTPIALEGVTYSTLDETVATVDAATGEVTLVAPGTTTIFASFAGDNQFNAAEASYRLTVNEAAAPLWLTAVSPYYVFNFSDFDEAEYAVADAEYIVNNMGILVTGKNTIKINGNNKTVDGVKYTKRLQLGGTGSTTTQNIHVKVNGPCQVTVVAVSGNSDEARELAINIAGNETAMAVPGDAPQKVMARYFEEGEADVYIYSKKSGINLYAVIVEEIAARTAEVTFNKYGMGTFCYENIDFVVPEGVQAATYALNAEGTKVAPHKLFAAGDVIPKDEAVVIKGEPNTTYTFTEKLEPANIYYDANNLLIGQETAGMIEGSADFAYYYYTLGAKNGVCGFYWGAADGGVFELGAHKAFLALEQETAANVSIVMFDGTATGINAIQTRENKGADGIYNLNGQKVNAQYKGVVIVNGKKQIRK